MTLRSIPPARRPQRRVQARMPAPPRWQPRILPRPQRLPPGVCRQDVVRQVRQRLADLTEEIAHWLPEFGEAALLHLYEARAGWGTLLQTLEEGG